MPALDLPSLGLLTLFDFIAMALVLPVVMGTHISPAARHVQQFFAMQAITWTAMLLLSRLRDTPWEPVLAICATGVIAGGQLTLFRALTLWLGPRPGRRWLLLCGVAGPLGFALLWPQALPRFIWFSAFQGLGLMILARACLAPRKECATGWRWVLCGCALAVALALWVRAFWAWAGPEPLNYTSHSPVNHAFIVLCNLCGALMLASTLAAWRDESDQQLRALVVTDELTRLLNRRGFEERSRAMLAHAQRQGLPLTVLMLDLDHFKQINDAHGHEGGDNALRLFGRLLQAQTRVSDLAARIGGEEFCLLLHGDTATGQALDARLRTALRANALAELDCALDYSAGLAELPAHNADLPSLLARADAALYEAKASGRGHLRCAAPLAPPPVALAA